jgi:hypothetical protein
MAIKSLKVLAHGAKNFMSLSIGVNDIKDVSSLLMLNETKLECLFLASLCSLGS